jgi:(2Fe-2S) ferredoxin
LEPDTVLVTGTKARTESEWNYLLQQYSILYWKADAEKAIEIVNKLKAEGRIVQQRLEERRWVSI